MHVLAGGVGAAYESGTGDGPASSLVGDLQRSDAPVPLAYLRAEADLVMFGAYAEAGYFTVASSDIDGSLLDLEIGAELRPLPGLHFLAGYRHITIDVEGTSNSDDCG